MDFTTGEPGASSDKSLAKQSMSRWHIVQEIIILGNGVSSPWLEIVLDLSTLKLMKMVLVIHGKL